MDNYDWHDWIEQLARAIAASKLGEKGNNTKSRNERIINIVRERGNRSCNLITYIYVYMYRQIKISLNSSHLPSSRLPLSFSNYIVQFSA